MCFWGKHVKLGHYSPLSLRLTTNITYLPERRRTTDSWWRKVCSLTALALALLLSATVAIAQAPASATTTMTEQTANNTSAADSFVSTNGNLNGGNVSKVPLRSLLYDGASTKIYAHFVGWFGGRDHIDVGYQSADPLQVHKQVADMVSRGIDGVVIDWYGPSSYRRSATARNTETATQALMDEAEQIPGFEFAIMVDKGALGGCRQGCNATSELIWQMTYVHDTYQKSPAYMRVNGRPVVLFFGVDRAHGDIDWERVKREVPENPILVKQDVRGFDDPVAQSGYAWVKLDRQKSRNWMHSYLHWFYGEGKKHATNTTDTNVFGAVYKGFDDSMATWSEGRTMSQDCGRTWLRTWATISEQYSASEPLQALQMVTWNDYEEGTEIESGIDNCVQIHAWRSGESVKWHVKWTDGKQADLDKNGPEDDVSPNAGHLAGIRGSDPEENLAEAPETGVDHYAVFISPDRETLTQVAEVPVSEHTFDLASLQLPVGTYHVYVQAVGKPGLLNHMAGGGMFEVVPPPPVIALP